MLDSLAYLTVVAAVAAFVHHHFAYPVILGWLAERRRRAGRVSADQATDASGVAAELPTVTVIVPAYNEARFIADKVRNLAAIDYPRDRLRIVIALDGCRDATEALARQAFAEVGSPAHIEIVAHASNRGKLAVLNEAIGRARSTIVALSDASATVGADALMRAARHFADPGVGVVCPTYRLSKPGSAGEAAYWTYQTRLKADEAVVGAPMGAHGAFYLFRRAAYEPLRADTINDDFILPMSIVAKGYRAVYDPTIVALEMEQTRSTQEFGRRVRIGAGNMQQVIRLASLGSLRNPGMAFVFWSGKGLRPVVPMLAVAAGIAALYLAVTGSVVMQVGSVLAAFAIGAAVFAISKRSAALPKPVAWLGYLVEGHTASLIGAVRYLRNPSGSIGWSAGDGIVRTETVDAEYQPKAVRIGKRVFDIVCTVGALVLLSVLFIPLALAIKLESPGPIFYRQLRVGRCRPHMTELFYLIKFRTMYQDAEARSGAVWASKNDPRITRVGRFLRKTRLDELPQLWNVLKGEMSFIGPRPERPKLIPNLQRQIPFYLERNYYVLPGITGLAQVKQGYDETIDDVRRKVMFDHAYAGRLVDFWSWLKADIAIVFGTISVMALGRGQ